MTRLASILGVRDGRDAGTTVRLRTGHAEEGHRLRSRIGGNLDIHREHDGHARGAVSSCE